jgi:hypothetical protein
MNNRALGAGARLYGEAARLDVLFTPYTRDLSKF